MDGQKQYNKIALCMLAHADARQKKQVAYFLEPRYIFTTAYHIV